MPLWYNLNKREIKWGIIMTKNAWINKRILQKILSIFVTGVVFATFFAQTPKLNAEENSANIFDSDTFRQTMFKRVCRLILIILRDIQMQNTRTKRF